MSKTSPFFPAVLAALCVAVVMSGTSPVLAEGPTGDAPLSIAHASSRISIDGRLDEWALRPGEWGSVSWDESFLYLAVQVRDGTPDGGDDRTRDFAGSDRVVLLISSAPSGLPATDGEPLTERDFAFIFVPDSRYHRPLKSIYGFGGFEHVEFDLRQVALAAVPEVGGYSLEARVPWSSLKVAPSVGKSLGLQLLVYDAYRPGAPLMLTRSGKDLGSVRRGLIGPALLGP